VGTLVDRITDPAERRRIIAENPGICERCFDQPHYLHASEDTVPVGSARSSDWEQRQRQIDASDADERRRNLARPLLAGTLNERVTRAEEAVEAVWREFDAIDAEWHSARGALSAYPSAAEKREVFDLARRRALAKGDYEAAQRRRDSLLAAWEEQHNPAAARIRRETREAAQRAQRGIDEEAAARKRAEAEGADLSRWRHAGEGSRTADWDDIDRWR
jgi:hypothetical protein